MVRSQRAAVTLGQALAQRGVGRDDLVLRGRAVAVSRRCAVIAGRRDSSVLRRVRRGRLGSRLGVGCAAVGGTWRGAGGAVGRRARRCGARAVGAVRYGRRARTGRARNADVRVGVWIVGRVEVLVAIWVVVGARCLHCGGRRRRRHLQLLLRCRRRCLLLLRLLVCRQPGVINRRVFGDSLPFLLDGTGTLDQGTDEDLGVRVDGRDDGLRNGLRECLVGDLVGASSLAFCVPDNSNVVPCGRSPSLALPHDTLHIYLTDPDQGDRRAS